MTVHLGYLRTAGWNSSTPHTTRVLSVQIKGPFERRFYPIDYPKHTSGIDSEIVNVNCYSFENHSKCLRYASFLSDRLSETKLRGWNILVQKIKRTEFCVPQSEFRTNLTSRNKVDLEYIHTNCLVEHASFMNFSK